MHHGSCLLDSKVYAGNLGNNGNRLDWNRLLPIMDHSEMCGLPNPPGFAFIEFEDPQDSANAVQELDGRTLCGCYAKMELSNGEKNDYCRRSPPPLQGESSLAARAVLLLPFQYLSVTSFSCPL
uniref:RRM domain-containing protein n=1 Tax=Prolemur simus TaxID=1328070 RepID=A0A8C9DKA2_PROSS